MTHYLVTGGTGFLGASLVQALVKAGHRVRVFDNGSRGSKERLGDAADKVEWFEADIRDPKAVFKAIQGVDSVCHYAFVNGTRYFYEQPAYVLDVGIKGMMNVVDGCIHHKVKELLVISSSEVYQTAPKVPTDETVPLSVPDVFNARYSYGGGKILSELVAINYGRQYFDRVLIVRPHNVYGPNMGWEHVIPELVHRICDSRKKNPKGDVELMLQGNGKQTRSFIFVDDFTRGVMQVLSKGKHGELYHIGTMDERPIRDLALEIAKCLEIPVRLASGEEPKGATPRRCPDIAKMRALGFEPQISLEEGLRRTAPWYRDHQPPPASKLSIAVPVYIKEN